MPSNTLRELHDLALGVSTQWRALGSDSEETFSSIATEAVRTWLASSTFSVPEFARELAAADTLPTQGRTDTGFGQPPITAYSDEHLRLDLIFWADGTTGIHQHAFCGAFGVVLGSSVHSVYEFTPQTWADQTTTLGVGKLTLNRTELLRTGDVRPITAGATYIHSLFHLDAPSVSLVLRTHTSVGSDPEYEYKPPGVVVDPSAQTIEERKRLQFARMSYAVHPEGYRAMVTTALESCTPPETYALLAHARSRGVEESLYDDFLATAARRLRADVIEFIDHAAREEARRAAVIARRSQVDDPELRFFLALVLNLPDREAIDRLIVERQPGHEPIEWLVRCVMGLSDLGALELSVDAEIAKILRELLSNPSREDAVASVTERYHVERSMAPAIAAVAELLASSPVLRPLFQ